MNTDERALATALRHVSADAPPVRIPDDLWARGSRRRRRRLTAMAAGVTVLVALAAAPLAWAPRPEPAPVAEGRSIPSTILAPWPLQPKLVDAPNGPASVIVTGPGGFGANDFFGYDDRAIVVGRDGRYRYVRGINGFNAGEDLLLSPDGRYLAGGPGLEGVESAGSASEWQATAGVMDLTTGQVRTYRHGRPVAWSPNGRLVTSQPDGDLSLLDVSSGDAVSLGVTGASSVAFSADGAELAVQVGTELTVVDVRTRTTRLVTGLVAGQLLAGPGAWSAGHLALWNREDCGPSCPAGLAEFSLFFVDIASGEVVDTGVDPVTAVSASLLGWQADGDAVVVLAMTAHGPDGPHSGAPQVLALHPSGGQTSLITVRADADRIDIPRDLLDHFGGPSASGRDLAVDMLAIRLRHALLPLGVIVALVAARLVYRRFRDGFWPWLPRRVRDAGRHPGSATRRT